MFEPRVALASLSGRSDASWARAGVPHAGAAFLGGIAIDEPTREAARAMVARDRTEFLPPEPIAFIERQFEGLSDVPIRPGINVRTASREPIPDVARLCADHDAFLELNAHCRQEEMCEAEAGESLLADPERLSEYVHVAAEQGACVGVKVRAETGVDLAGLAAALETAGADFVHVDAMDTESAVAAVRAATECFLLANNGVRDRQSVFEYLRYGADAVSIGRASDDSTVLARVCRATEAWFGTRTDQFPATVERDTMTVQSAAEGVSHRE